MHRSRYLIPALALSGVLAGVAFVARGNVAPPVAQPIAQPAVAPFQSYIAGSGLIESSTRNIAISTPVGGVLAEAFVKVGDRVAKDRPLFRIDGRDLEAQLAARQAAAVAARAQIPEAEATLGQARNDLGIYERLAPNHAVSQQDLANRRYAVQLDEAKLGTARANADEAAAQVAETEANIDRLTVHAPVEADILQVNVRPGEYASTGLLSSPLILLGDTRTVHVRVDVDENDAWRFRSGVRAKAFLRGNSAIAFDMTFAYVEPYVVPKLSLTGASTERVDTRVLQVVFSAPKKELPIYAGQQVDVYIETSADPDPRQDRPDTSVPAAAISSSLVNSVAPTAAPVGQDEN
ncbi:MAG TPA: efflux RND transporter periplasmic adaptor subunit [Xanthobacteraceae bacterium]|nr:efflux RND transporter periplasmic adaptor subunit [Xanthobacteraceae bacterium]